MIFPYHPHHATCYEQKEEQLVSDVSSLSLGPPPPKGVPEEKHLADLENLKKELLDEIQKVNQFIPQFVEERLPAFKVELMAEITSSANSLIEIPRRVDQMEENIEKLAKQN